MSAVDKGIGTVLGGIISAFTDKETVTEGERLARAQIQMAAYGKPIPIVYGTQRIAGHLVWLDEFTAVRHEDSTSAGKGGETTITNVTYTYTACVILAICEGPVAALLKVWADKLRFADPAAAGFDTVLLGTRPQSPWAHLMGSHPDKALGYGGTALVADPAIDLGASGALDNYTFEVKGFQATYAHTYLDPVSGDSVTAYDAHPADVITDLLTSLLYGGGMSGSRIAAFNVGQDGTANSSYVNYCHAFGVYLSPMITDQRALLEWLQDILAASNAAAVWSGGKLKVYPYGDTAGSANGYTYAPATAVQYDLTNDDFLREGEEDPIIIRRRPLRDTYNIIPVEYLDRTQDYKPTPVEDADQADVEAFGERRGSATGLHMICRKDVALMASRLAAQRSCWVRTEYRFRLPWRYALLEPMDLVTLTESKLGLDHRLVRITEIEEDEEGTLKVVAEECPLGLSTHTVYSPPASDGMGQQRTVDPGNVNTPFIMPGPALNTGGTEMWIAASGASAYWGGCDVYVSEDGSTYEWVGQVTRKARHGTLTANLAASTQGALDAVGELKVSLLGGGEFSGTSDDGRDAALTLCCLEQGELLSFKTATLTAPGAYTLTSLRRGQAGGVATGGTTGQKFARLDDAIFKWPVPAAKMGKTLYVKLASFNCYGTGQQSLAGLSAYTFTVAASAVTQPVQQATPLQKGSATTLVLDDGAVSTAKLAALAVETGKLADDAVTADKLAVKSILAQHLVLTNWENLVPNGYVTETAPLAGSYEAAGLYQVGSGFSVSGWYKRTAATGAGQYARTQLTPYLPVVPGEQYFMKARGNRSAASGAAYLEARFYGPTGTDLAVPVGTSSFAVDAALGGDTQGVGFIVPTGAATMTVSLTYYNGTVGHYVYAAAILTKRMADADLIVDGTITASKIAADELKTTNYLQDVNGNAVRGAKLDHQGTALKVARSGLRIGSSTVEEWFRRLAVSNWEPLSLVNQTWTAVCDGGLGSVSLHLLGTNVAYRSINGGRSWAAVTIGAGAWADADGNNNVVVAVGSNVAARLSPANSAAAYTAPTIPAASWIAVKYQGYMSRWWAIASGGQTAYCSTGNFTSGGALPAGPTAWVGMYRDADNDLWAVGNNTTTNTVYVAKLNPGSATWSLVTSFTMGQNTVPAYVAATGIVIGDVAVDGGTTRRFILMTNDLYLYTSGDGTTWDFIPVGSMGSTCGAFGNGTFVLGSTSMDWVSFSTDGVNFWNSSTALGLPSIQKVLFCPYVFGSAARFFVVGNNPTVATDPRGGLSMAQYMT